MRELLRVVSRIESDLAKLRDDLSHVRKALWVGLEHRAEWNDDGTPKSVKPKADHPWRDSQHRSANRSARDDRAARAIKVLDPSAPRLISPNEMMTLLGVSSPTLWRMRRRGDIPEPIRISANRIGWREDVIAEWFVVRQAEAKKLL